MNRAAPALDPIRRALDAGRIAEARRLAARAVAEFPHDNDAMALAGIAARLDGFEATGMALLAAAVRRAPGNARWLAALCRGHAERFDRVRALPAGDDAGGVCWPGWVSDALADIDRLTALRPRDVASLLLAGRFHKAAGDDRRARAHGEAALGIEPDNVEALKLAGEAAGNLRDFATAEVHYRRALACAPDDAMARWLMAMRRLCAADFDAGWRGYEARFEAFPAGTASFPFTLPRWHGEDLAGRTLLVHGEQGLGDEIMFASILPEVIARADSVLVGASPSLASMFARSFPGAVVHPHDRSPPAVQRWRRESPPAWLDGHHVDWHAPIGSLARWLRPGSDSFPGTPYLQPDPDKVARFDEKLVAAEGGGSRPPRVGVNLATNRATGLMGLLKHVPSSAFEPVFRKFAGEAHFVLLHVAGESPVDGGDSGARLSDFAADLVDLDATAALIACLDAVVTTDSAVAHLAGALGTPTLVMLRHSADWRYGDEGERCIWYHCLRLVRQQRRGDWAGVVDAVTERLASLLDAASTKAAARTCP